MSFQAEASYASIKGLIWFLSSITISHLDGVVLRLWNLHQPFPLLGTPLDGLEKAIQYR